MLARSAAGFAGGFLGALLGNIVALTLGSPLGTALDYALVYGLLGCALGTSARGRLIAGASGFLFGLVPGFAEGFFRSPTYQAYGHRMGFIWVVMRYALHLIGGFSAGAGSARRRRILAGAAVAVSYVAGQFLVSSLVQSIAVLQFAMNELRRSDLPFFLVMDSLLVAFAGALAGAALGWIDREPEDAGAS